MTKFIDSTGEASKDIDEELKTILNKRVKDYTYSGNEAISDIKKLFEPQKKTEFVKGINSNMELFIDCVKPTDWENVERIRTTDSFDIMIAWDDLRENSATYLGHWNDGC